jgi:hypothetical protein
MAEPDSAIFHSRISKLLPSKIAAAALSNGLPDSSLPALIAALANNKADELEKVPGITPKIIGASVVALKEAYLESFKSVWIAVCCFSAVGVIGEQSKLEFNNYLQANTVWQAHSGSSILPNTSITVLMPLPNLRKICMARQIMYVQL